MTNRVTQAAWTRNALNEHLKFVKRMTKILETAIATFNPERIHPAARRVRIAIARIEQSAYQEIKDARAAKKASTNTQELLDAPDK